MESRIPNASLSDYQVVLNAFIELRSHGVTVSAQDLEVLKSWADDHLPPRLIIEAMEAIALENKDKGKRFSASLKALDRSVRRAVREAMNY